MSSQSSSDVGLCSGCRFANVQRSGRGSEFWRCEKSDTDERFLRYPRLPVRECQGYATSETSESSEPPETAET